MVGQSNDVVVVGAGRLGLFLARVLPTRGRPVAGVVVRSPESGARLTDALPGIAILSVSDEQLLEVGTLLLCVADDELPGLVQSLVQSRSPDPGRLVAHTSGRHGLGVLAGLPGPIAAIHPAMTFTGTPADLQIPLDMAYGVTATGAGLVAARALVTDLGGRVELVPEGRRPLYHAAISHAANHLNTLMADAADLLAQAGIEDTSGVLRPIAEAALANALGTDPATGRPAGTAALTGPVVRGDVGTLAAHLDALDGDPVEPTYLAMARRTAERAAAAGRLSPERAAELLALIASGG